VTIDEVPAGETRRPVDPERVAGLSRMVGLDPPVYRRRDMEERVGVTHEEMVRWWRAMGFAEVPEDVVAFVDTDVQMARRLLSMVGADLLDDDAVLRLARLLGASFSRIAEAQAAVLDDILLSMPAGDPDLSPWDRIQALERDPDTSLLALLEDSLVYVWRRHLVAALSRWLGAEEDLSECAVGFADISGFSKLTRELTSPELAEIIDAFETAAFDVVSARGGRVVKLIGDEVMFLADTLEDGVDIGLDLLDRLADRPEPVQLHCGVAFGPTITVGGDVFGPTVNLASRMTDVARRGKVVIPREHLLAVEDRADLETHRVRRVFDLKGIGRTRLATVNRLSADEDGGAGAGDPDPGDDGDADDRRPLPAGPMA
jgi:adenylate cyclase